MSNPSVVTGEEPTVGALSDFGSSGCYRHLTPTPFYDVPGSHSFLFRARVERPPNGDALSTGDVVVLKYHRLGSGRDLFDFENLPDHPLIMRPYLRIFDEFGGAAADVLPNGQMDLRQWTTGRRLPADEVTTLAIAMATAVDVTYRAGIIHGDVKLGQFIITDTGLTLADWDHAVWRRRSGERAGRGDGVEEVTVSASVPGMVQSHRYVPWWTAPGRASASTQRDAWALLVCWHELLTGGRHPVEGEKHLSAGEVLADVIRMDWTRWRAAPDIDAGWSDLLERNVAATRESFPTAGDLLKQVQALAPGRTRFSATMPDDTELIAESAGAPANDVSVMTVWHATRSPSPADPMPSEDDDPEDHVEASPQTGSRGIDAEAYGSARAEPRRVGVYAAVLLVLLMAVAWMGYNADAGLKQQVDSLVAEARERLDDWKPPTPDDFVAESGDDATPGDWGDGTSGGSDEMPPAASGGEVDPPQERSRQAGPTLKTVSDKYPGIPRDGVVAGRITAPKFCLCSSGPHGQHLAKFKVKVAINDVVDKPVVLRLNRGRADQLGPYVIVSSNARFRTYHPPDGSGLRAFRWRHAGRFHIAVPSNPDGVIERVSANALTWAAHWTTREIKPNDAWADPAPFQSDLVFYVPRTAAQRTTLEGWVWYTDGGYALASRATEKTIGVQAYPGTF